MNTTLPLSIQSAFNFPKKAQNMNIWLLVLHLSGLLSGEDFISRNMQDILFLWNDFEQNAFSMAKSSEENCDNSLAWLRGFDWWVKSPGQTSWSRLLAEVWVRIPMETYKTWVQASFWIPSAADATLSSDANMCLIWGAINILPFFFHFSFLFRSMFRQKNKWSCSGCTILQEGSRKPMPSAVR